MISFLQLASHYVVRTYNLQTPAPSTPHLLYTPHRKRWPSRDVQDPLDLAATWVSGAKKRYLDYEPAEIDAVGGLLALVMQYLNEGFYGPSGRLSYVKSCFSVLCRTNFAAMYRSLGRAKKLFTPDLVMQLWDPSSEYGRTKAVIPTGFKEIDNTGREPRDYTEQTPKIGDWLDSIVSPPKESKDDQKTRRFYADDEAIKPHLDLKEKDLMSRGVCAYNSISMGLLPMPARRRSSRGRGRVL
jgi:hypothetical protein